MLDSAPTQGSYMPPCCTYVAIRGPTLYTVSSCCTVRHSTGIISLDMVCSSATTVSHVPVEIRLRRPKKLATGGTHDVLFTRLSVQSKECERRKFVATVLQAPNNNIPRVGHPCTYPLPATDVEPVQGPRLSFREGPKNRRGESQTRL